MSAKLSRPVLLSPDDFHSVVRLAPLVSIDFIIRNARGEVLLGLRNNEPAKGFYCVPGGIILKQERLHEAFARILKRANLTPSTAKCAGGASAICWSRTVCMKTQRRIFADRKVKIGLAARNIVAGDAIGGELVGRREEDFQRPIKFGRDHAESCIEPRNEKGTTGRLLPRGCSMCCAKNIQSYR